MPAHQSLEECQHSLAQQTINHQVQTYIILYKKTAEIDDIISLKSIQREIDGTKNNKLFPKWGSSFIPYERKNAIQSYKDGIKQYRTDLENPRKISNIVGSQVGKVQTSRLKLTLAFTTWGQYVDHQITYTKDVVDQGQQKYILPKQDTSQIQMNNPVPKGDSTFDSKSKGNIQLDFKRSIAEQSKKIRNKINMNTAWIDARTIYGKTPQIQQKVRAYKNGKLVQDKEKFLPKDQNNFFIAGDDRVGQNIALTAIQTVLMREHNRLCDLIIAKNPKLSDDQIFKAARNFVIGLISKITYDDYLPLLLGKLYFAKYIGQYKTYDPNVCPNISNEFSTGAYRIGHSLLTDDFPQIDANNKIIQTLKLSQIFQRNNFYTKNIQIQTTLRGIIQTLTKQKSCTMVDSLRNLLMPDPDNQDFRADLYAFNIQRGRDQGIPSYNECRKIYGLLPYITFIDYTLLNYHSKNLNLAYKNVNDVELFPGILCQTPLLGSVVGSLGAVMIGDGFKRIRDGDRFWYEYAYPKSVVQEIKSTTLSDIIMRNTGMKNLPRNIFVLCNF